MRAISWISVVAAVILLSAPPAPAAKEKDIDVEKKLGQQAAVEADKTLKFVTDDPAMAKRVETIGQSIAAVARVTKVPAGYGASDLADFPYTFKLVKDKEVNAFSLPAGYVYVNSGLLKRVESDDELAGVLAHEIAHVAHHHMLKLLRKQSQIDNAIFLLIAAAAAGKMSSQDMGNIVYGAKLVEIAKVNSYSQVAENDADATAIQYMIKAKYNPVGMLTFMEKLARDQAYDPVDPGIFQNHPYSRDRANAIIADLKKAGIAINRRAVSAGLEAFVRGAVVAGVNITEVVMGKEVVFRAADIAGSTSADRAKAVADAINRQIDESVEPRDVKLSSDGLGVSLKQELVIDVLQADADIAGTTREAVATKAKEAIQAALMAEQMKLMY